MEPRFSCATVLYRPAEDQKRATRRRKTVIHRMFGVALLAATLVAGGVANAAVTPGNVVAWGDNSYGQTNVPAGLSGVTAIAASYYHGMALKSDGTVAAWGFNCFLSNNNLSGVVAIAVGD